MEKYVKFLFKFERKSEIAIYNPLLLRFFEYVILISLNITNVGESGVIREQILDFKLHIHYLSVVVFIFDLKLLFVSEKTREKTRFCFFEDLFFITLKQHIAKISKLRSRDKATGIPF